MYKEETSRRENVKTEFDNCKFEGDVYFFSDGKEAIGYSTVLEVVAEAVVKNTAYYEEKFSGEYQQCGQDIIVSVKEALADIVSN